MFPMAPMNNPVLVLVQAMQRGGNPMALMQTMAQQNPQQLEQMARSMAQERGIDINQMIRQLGINNASFR